MPIRPITKRPRQKTPELSILPLLSLRPTKTFTSTPTAFNSSQIDVDKLESEEGNSVAQVISELESEEESKSKEEDNITYANEYLDQDLKELGQDRLDRENMDKLDIEKEVSKEFKTSKFFR